MLALPAAVVLATAAAVAAVAAAAALTPKPEPQPGTCSVCEVGYGCVAWRVWFLCSPPTCAPTCLSACVYACRSISPRAVANDDAAANLTFTNCAFLDNVYNTWGCENQREWFCSFTGPPGAAGVTTASNATFSGSTVFRRNSWGALYVASPVTVTFEGKLVVADNTKRLWGQGFEYDEDNFATEYGAGLIASGGARLLFFGAVQIR